MIRFIRQVVRATAWLVLLIGAPIVLTTVVAVATPIASWRSQDTDPRTMAMIDIADLVGWLLWAILTGFVARRLVTAVRAQVHWTRLPMSLHGTVTAITGLAAVGAASLWHSPPSTAAAAPTTAVPTTTRTQPTPAGAVRAADGTSRPPLQATTDTRPAGPPAPAESSSLDGHRTILVSATSSGPAPSINLPVYQVQHNDWLGDIADRYLGQFSRYPDLQRLNPHLITDPDHIEPGWQLVLPADAHDHGPHAHATGNLAAPPAATDPSPTATDPGPATAGNGTTAGDAGPNATGTPSPPAGSTTPGTGRPTADTRQDPGDTSGAGSTGDTVAPTPTSGPSVAPTTPWTAPPAPATTTPRTTADRPASSGSTTSADPNTTASTASRPLSNAAPRHGTGSSARSRAGVTMPGGWVSIPLAAALLGVVTLLWLRRRHRYVPGPLHTADADLLPPPPVVARIRRAVRAQAPDLLHPDPPAQPTVTQHTTSPDEDQPPLPPIGPTGPQLAGLTDPLPPAGLALTGPGAHAAARGLLIATLSAGSPDDPDARGQVVIPADTLATLLGEHAAIVQTTPRLHVTSTLCDALTIVEDMLIERRRILEDHDADDLDQMRAADPYHPPMPPILLITDAPGTDPDSRLATTLHLGAPLGIHAVLLGDRPDTPRRTVHADGSTDDGQRLTVLDVNTTIQLLDVIHEAYTGHPAPAPVQQPQRPIEPAPADNIAATSRPDSDLPDTAVPTHDGAPDEGAAAPDPHGGGGPAPADEPTDVADGGAPATAPDPVSADQVSPNGPASPVRRRLPIRVDVLGEPAIHHRDGTATTGLRQHARELLVYLAVHRGGANLADIMEVMWPTATLRRAGERLSTEAGEVRRRIRDAAGDPPDTTRPPATSKRLQPIINTGSRYHLDPTIVDIDLWRLDDALRDAAAATNPAARAAALQRAIDMPARVLADGYDYDWIDQPREHARRQTVRAHVHLADLVTDNDPQQAAQLYTIAADLDPINEDITQRTLRALAAVRDAAGIRTRIQHLRAALDAIDEEPTPETLALAAQLQRDLDAPPGPAGPLGEQP